MHYVKLFESYKENTNLYYFLLASLIESADKVANTASVYGSFLKTLKPLARQEMVLEACTFEADAKCHQVLCEDANALIHTIEEIYSILTHPITIVSMVLTIIFLTRLLYMILLCLKGKQVFENTQVHLIVSEEVRLVL